MSDLARVYEELADLEDQRGAAQNRDRFLILAADAARADGAAARAEELRARLLQYNPHHLLKPYPSLADALRSPDVQSYVADLRHTYPPKEAERLLESMRAGGPGPEEPEKFPAPAIDEQTVDETPAPPEPEPEEAEEPEPEIYPLRGVAPPREAPPPKLRAAVPPPPPVEEGDVFPLPSRKHVPAERSESTAVSAWVSTILSAVVLGAAVGLGVYTFGRPFLQR